MYQKALAVLLWHSENGKVEEMTAGALVRVMHENGLGASNSTSLKQTIARTKLATKRGNTFRLKAAGKLEIQQWLKGLFDEREPEVSHSDGFLPSDIWQGTRGFLEKVCIQLNGCYKFGYYDAAAVMVRRIVETLIIEVYVHVKRDLEIKDSDGNYLMLSGLVGKTLGTNGLSVGRDTKKNLQALKDLGDRSAHKRNYNAIKNDLEKVQTPLRVTVDELINLSELKKGNKN
jgi:hypothetical protein